MKISTSKSEAMVLNRKKVECLLRVKEEILPQVEEFKYLGVLFTSEGRMEQEIDRRISAASAETPGKIQDTLERLCLSTGLGIPLDELEEVAGEREVWASLLRLLPPRPDPR
ncbi:hypothetical protein D4764_05G0011540 [Takifugu flavidus]|uniref:Uncharacterized protein n=1 Tax=Takifugu flavidus TaxID=433684 RepID=A0A5C6N0I1_9TELE|nr:hypothetical protein D4764_05G0011540 [Takifugu flavidus]